MARVVSSERECFDNEVSTLVWKRKYRYAATASGKQESSIRDTWRRVAHAVASVETARQSHWADRFGELLEGFRFLPAGRILASAGTDYDATLFNCFVMGPIEDSIAAIFERLRESAVTMQRGGGIGCDFSTLRPAGTAAVTSGRTASGPVSFMHLWDSMCSTLLSTGNRRGAMMGVLRCDHPDIVEFIEAKRETGALTNFNLSVLISDAFMHAASAGQQWKLVFPAEGSTSAPAVHAKVDAAQLWHRIVDAAYDTAEPGVLFVDRINELNNLHYREHITATNPCGEVPLPPYGACNLGSINLAAYVESPYTDKAHLNLDAIGQCARDATRFLDNVIDLSAFPLPSQAAEARATRRIGLGVTALADALIMLGHRYDSATGREVARAALTRIRDDAYGTSIELAREKGSFPAFDRDAWLDGRYARTLPGEIRDRIAEHGLRNSHLLAIAPAGSISILANNLSSGIEPVFAARMDRIVLGPEHEAERHAASDYAYSLWSRSESRRSELPRAFVTALEVPPEDHLLMAAALQPVVDNSISKTVNVSEAMPREGVRRIYGRAFDLGLKGCTVFRSNPVRGEVLSEPPRSEMIHCCAPDREGD
jgi:ribonucleoside-diphosphate reductase alpha chain